jgi:hypothetical protein
MPHSLFRNPVSPGLPEFINTTEQLPLVNRGRNKPVVQLVSHPVGHWNGSDVASFTDQIHNCPMFLALLNVIPR